MNRVTNSSLSKHKKIRKAAKGFVGNRKNFKTAKEAVRNSMFQKTEIRKHFRSKLRSQIWIPRINSFARVRFNLSYSQFMSRCEMKDRKVLVKLISTQPELVEQFMLTK